MTNHGLIKDRERQGEQTHDKPRTHTAKDEIRQGRDKTRRKIKTEKYRKIQVER